MAFGNQNHCPLHTVCVLVSVNSSLCQGPYTKEWIAYKEQIWKGSQWNLYKKLVLSIITAYLNIWKGLSVEDNEIAMSPAVMWKTCVSKLTFKGANFGIQVSKSPRKLDQLQSTCKREPTHTTSRKCFTPAIFKCTATWTFREKNAWGMNS
jgi:hypothetical protein